LIRRLAIISLVDYIKNTPQSLDINEVMIILKKSLNHPHPVLFSTVFYALNEISNKNYIELGIPQRFTYLCENLNKVDDFYFERMVFTLVNFSKLFLFNNFDKNNKYIIKFFNSLYKQSKYTTNNSKIISCLTGIYEMIIEIDKLNLNSISIEELNLFKNKKQLIRISELLLKSYLCSKNNIEKFQTLELINSYCKTIDYFIIIKENIEKHYNNFFLKYNDKEYINSKKLEILVKLVNINNIKTILEELKRNLYYSPNLNRMIITSIYIICKFHNDNKMSSICIERLIDLLKLKEENIIAHIIICLRRLIQEVKENTKYVLIYSIKNFKKNISSSLARANIIWMISQYIYLIPTVSVDFFRRLLIEIDTESDDVKSQILGLALRINNSFKLIKYTDLDRIVNMIKYAIEKLLYDKNYNIREKARMTDFLIKNGEDWEEIYNISEKIYDNNHNNNFLLSINDKSLDIEQKYVFDNLSNDVDANIYKISLDDIINVCEEVKQTPNRIVSVVQQNNTKSTIENFDSSVNIEQIRNKLKNELDDLLNNSDENEDWEVEIQKE
jgi:hypothetical protein